MAVTSLRMDDGGLRLANLRRAAGGPVHLKFPAAARRAVERCQAAVNEILERDEAVYGLNTGFGSLAQVRIPLADLAALQRNLVLSHAVGTGPQLSEPVVRLVLLLKIAALARGYSGVRWSIVDALRRLLAADVLPCIPAKGSAGASGDLAPLAHLAAALIGVGQVRCQGRIVAAAEGLRTAGLEPLVLGPKEGLALLNGTQVSCALALIGLFRIEDVFNAALVAGALSVEAARGADTPFDARIHALRGQQGQIEVAAQLWRFLAGSAIRRSHLDCGRVQDPYSLRCQPQVMGACLDHIRFAAGILEREANAVTDNPLIFPDDGAVLSGGNFHGEPVAMAADVLAIAAAEIGALSERRVALLVDQHFSGLPPFLVQESGLNSGFMAAQIAAAALASENKVLAHPASVDSMPTAANQEDHVSMATFAARRLSEIADNVAGIVGIELLAAVQGVEFHAGLSTSGRLRRAIALVRSVAARLERDRYLAPDIEAAKALAASGAFNAAIVPPLTPSANGRRSRGKGST
jgi:histidine ammonia-lyase